MDIIEDLAKHLLNQPFDVYPNEESVLEGCKNVAQMYALIEHSIAVLSDLRTNQSYIYKESMANTLGFPILPNETIPTIWEEEIFRRIHPDDLFDRHLLELHFYHLLKSLPITERSHYHTQSLIRMKDDKGEYHAIRHRTLYLSNTQNGSLWLDMCLYNFSTEKSLGNGINGMIINTADGTVIRPDLRNGDDLLSEREKEVLKLIYNGMLSKEIASQLSISVHTVNRHRQNILEKLKVNSSIEALKVAQAMNLID